MHAIEAYVYLLVCLLFCKFPGIFNLGTMVDRSQYSISQCGLYPDNQIKNIKYRNVPILKNELNYVHKDPVFFCECVGQECFCR